MTQPTSATVRCPTSSSVGRCLWSEKLGLLIVAMCAPTLGLAAAPQGPCPFFDVAVVHKVFPNSTNEAVFKRRDKPFPSCTYIWNAKHMNSVKMGGLVVKVPSEGRLTLTKAPIRVEVKDWDRVLLGYGKQQLTPVPELGQYAVWSAQRRQLSWISKGHVFHVAVENDDHPDAQQQNAMAVAAELIRTH